MLFSTHFSIATTLALAITWGAAEKTVTETVYTTVEPGTPSGQIVPISINGYVTTIVIPPYAVSAHLTKPTTLSPFTPIIYPASYGPSLSSVLSIHASPYSYSTPVSTESAAPSPSLSARPVVTGSDITSARGPSVTGTKTLATPIMPIPISAEHSASAALASASMSAAATSSGASREGPTLTEATTIKSAFSAESASSGPASASSSAILTTGITSSIQSSFPAPSSPSSTFAIASASTSKVASSASLPVSTETGDGATGTSSTIGGLIATTTGEMSSSATGSPSGMTTSSSTASASPEASSTAAPNSAPRKRMTWVAILGSVLPGLLFL